MCVHARVCVCVHVCVCARVCVRTLIIINLQHCRIVSRCHERGDQHVMIEFDEEGLVVDQIRWRACQDKKNV